MYVCIYLSIYIHNVYTTIVTGYCPRVDYCKSAVHWPLFRMASSPCGHPSEAARTSLGERPKPLVADGLWIHGQFTGFPPQTVEICWNPTEIQIDSKGNIISLDIFQLYNHICIYIYNHICIYIYVYVYIYTYIYGVQTYWATKLDGLFESHDRRFEGP